MAKQILFLLIFLLVADILSAQNIIPKPAVAKQNSGHFVLNKHSSIAYQEQSLADEAYFLQKELFKQTGISLSISTVPAKGNILLSKNENPANKYQLNISSDQIHITGSNEESVFNAIISLIQMAQQANIEGENLHIPNWEIEDEPLYAWRGLMLDESRHFFGVKKVKQILDWMAYYKLNKFHWHLTDSPGWRIEIRKYPKLALVGGIGNDTNPYFPAQYYTQEEIKDIVRYAMERKIEIIPEIDMPGHATAANRAYPEFSGGGSERYPEFTFHPGKEGTYGYLADILREVNTLFPGNQIHLGGDEVSFGNVKWKTDPEVLALMEENNLSDLKEVENYFFKRMADSLLQMNNKVLAWDEMANTKLDKGNTIIFWWRHDQPEQLRIALENGYPTVICPRIPFYLDFVQEEKHQYGRKWTGAFSPVDAVYNFSIQDLPIPGDSKNLILGIQANLWTETVHNEDRLDFLLFPRIAAMAEAAWTPEDQKDYTGFLQRLEFHNLQYHRAGIYYYDPMNPELHPEPVFLPVNPE